MKTRELVEAITTGPTWEEAMARYQRLPMPERLEVRRAVSDIAIERHSPGEMGSSDFNHYLYGMIRTGEYDEILQQLGIQESEQPTKAAVAVVRRNTASFGQPFLVTVQDFPGAGDLTLPASDLVNAKRIGQRYAQHVEVFV